MQKRDVVDGGKISNKNIGAMKCGECLHFATSAHSKKGEVCSKIGIRAEGVAPSCFTPNVKELNVSSDMLMQVTALMSTLTRTQRRILAATMMTKQKKLRFGTKIYFRPMGADYVSNYRAGYVMGYSSAGDLMIVGDPDPNKRGNSFVALLRDDHFILNTEAWKTKRAELKAANLINDPELGKAIAKKTVLDDYEPPSLDTAPDHWFTKSTPPVPKKKGSVQEVAAG